MQTSHDFLLFKRNGWSLESLLSHSTSKEPQTTTQTTKNRNNYNPTNQKNIQNHSIETKSSSQRVTSFPQGSPSYSVVFPLQHRFRIDLGGRLQGLWLKIYPPVPGPYSLSLDLGFWSQIAYFGSVNPTAASDFGAPGLPFVSTCSKAFQRNLFAAQAKSCLIEKTKSNDPKNAEPSVKHLLES